MSSNKNRSMSSSKNSIKADAEFLEYAAKEQLEIITPSTSSTAYASLHRSNIIKLQTDQLLDESYITTTKTKKDKKTNITNSSDTLLGSVPWYNTIAEPYIDAVQYLLDNHLPEVTLNTPPSNKNNKNETGYPFQVFADRNVSVTIGGGNNNDDDSKLRMYTGYRRTESSVLNQLGYTNPQSGNANVIPTIERTILIPSSIFTSNDSSHKDYLRHRYTDKRNLIVWYVAQYLSKPEFKDVIGSVHWMYWKNDTRKPVLVLIPPLKSSDADNDDNTEGTSYKKSKKSHDKGDKKNKKNSITLPKSITDIPKMKKLRFRVVLHFGVDSINWIPPLRRIPNRCNITQNNTTKGTTSTKDQYSCYYNNNCLLEDAKHLWYYETPLGKVPEIESNTTEGESDNDNDYGEDDEVDIDYDESWYKNWNAAVVLAKIWCLQRGLLRGHDTLTTDIIIYQYLYLFRTKQANPIRMTPIQIFTVWLKLLADTDWIGHPNNDTTSKKSTKKRHVLVLPLPGKNEKQTIAASKLARLYANQARLSPISVDGKDPLTLIELYQSLDPEYTGPVFLDPSMTYNYMGRLSVSNAQYLQREASKSLNCLHTGSSTTQTSTGTNRLRSANFTVRDPISFLFMTEARFWKRHDTYLRINLKQIKSFRKLSNKDSDATGTKRFLEEFVDDDMGNYECTCRGIIKVLRLALGDRIRAITSLTNGNGSITKYSETTKMDKSGKVPTDSDEIVSILPVSQTSESNNTSNQDLVDPTGAKYLVLGITLNPDTCFRLVDRGPPADHTDDVQAFLDLWGGQKAELRRFKDGAIVHAVVWDGPPSSTTTDDNNYIQFQNDDKWQGGIVERIVMHILNIHFLKDKDGEKVSALGPQFSLRNMNSIVDGTALQQHNMKDKDTVTLHSIVSNPLASHRMVLKAFDMLSTFLRKNSTPTISIPGTDGQKKSVLALPLTIDAVEPISPALRYAELFPPVPHPFLGAPMLPRTKKIAGAIQSNPIEIQIRFGASSKWPTDIKAIGAAKTAMLIALVNSIESLKKNSSVDTDHFDGPNVVTASYADIGYMGYVFRIFIRADPELRLLRGLRNPNAEAQFLLQALTHKTVYAATHHTIVHAVFTSHPSSSATLRMARRWVASHLLSDHIPFEALELMVAYVYTNQSSPLDSPGTVTIGFLRFLQLLATFDWKREPLIVDPQGHFSDNDHRAIMKHFEITRGPSYGQGPAMYIISPCTQTGQDSNSESGGEDAANDDFDNNSWTPVFTQNHPEQIVLSRAVALAQRTHSFLCNIQLEFQPNAWYATFQESPTAFRSYSALLRVDPAFIVDTNTSSDSSELGVVLNPKYNVLESSYTRSMSRRLEGPKDLRRSLYRNVMMGKDDNILLEWRPVQAVMEQLRSKVGLFALFFYNDLCPEVLAVVWRRPLFQPRSFSAITSENFQPVTADDWQTDTLVTLNVGDVLRETIQYTSDIVMAIKVFDYGPSIDPPVNVTATTKRKNDETEGQDESTADSQDENDDSDEDSEN